MMHGRIGAGVGVAPLAATVPKTAVTTKVTAKANLIKLNTRLSFILFTLSLRPRWFLKATPLGERRKVLGSQYRRARRAVGLLGDGLPCRGDHPFSTAPPGSFDESSADRPTPTPRRAHSCGVAA